MRLLRAISYIFLFLYLHSYTQQTDSAKVSTADTSMKVTSMVTSDKKMSKPGKAALFSAIVPGLGQVYNNRWWKVPIVYSLIGGSAYMAINNHREFKKFDYVYTRRTAPTKLEGTHAYDNVKDTASIYKDFSAYSTDNIKYYATYHRDWRDKFIIITVLMYAANIIDAHVDAHLKNFNVSEDVAMRVRPSIIPTLKGFQSSIEFNFYFKNSKINENSISRLW